ncbi:MAG: magnesium protoporphyrin IX methyltransferase [Pseudanabaenaceae cyanobacterium bins.68]|nr:magnesium protoporphyrin IX methyltransferase [Pseudanabaenaceae cyanobacterium bins.68]
MNDKQVVKEYFNNLGFERWSRIYGAGTVSKVQQDIRDGHQQTIAYVLAWFKPVCPGLTVCDAGCGTGSLSLPLAQMGMRVFASDIAEKMVAEAQRQAIDPENPQFQVCDLTDLSGSYHTVVCLDVMIHYPETELAGLISHLASLASDRLIISFAPKNLYYTLLKKVGESFPGASKTTRAYLHPESRVRALLQDLGFQITRQEFTATQFYFSRLLEAVRSDKA